MELLSDARLAVMYITRNDFAETHASVPDTENLINIPLQIRSVEVSMLITEPPEGEPVRVSLRSKGQIDVARFAEQFGGGGHARAAGLKMPGTTDSVRSSITAAILTQLSNGEPRAASIE